MLDACWEASVPDMFFIGTSMASRDRRAASGFIHGFRYGVMSLFHILNQRFHDIPTPREVFTTPKMEDIVSFVIGWFLTTFQL